MMRVGGAWKPAEAVRDPRGPQLPAPYVFLKHFYVFIFYDMFIFTKTFLYAW
jgi:hypothetical protein